LTGGMSSPVFLSWVMDFSLNLIFIQGASLPKNLLTGKRPDFLT
jgi:hypothetical protein